MIRYLHAFLPMPCPFLPQVMSVVLHFCPAECVRRVFLLPTVMVLALRFDVLASFAVSGCFY